jgi:glycine cleavage system H protein
MVAILFVIMISAVLVFEWIAVRRKRAASSLEAAKPHALSGEDISLSDGLFYSPGHSWSALEVNGTLAVGADDLLLRLTGRIDGVDLPEVGRTLDKGDPLFSLRMGGHTLSVPSPVRGRIDAVNHDIVASPAMLNLPYHGWAVRLRPDAMAESLESMSIGAKAHAWIGSEITRLRDFFSTLIMEQAGAFATLQDGGMPVEGVLAELDDKSLYHFELDFLFLK